MGDKDAALRKAVKKAAGEIPGLVQPWIKELPRGCFRGRPIYGSDEYRKYDERQTYSYELLDHKLEVTFDRNIGAPTEYIWRMYDKPPILTVTSGTTAIQPKSNTALKRWLKRILTRIAPFKFAVGDTVFIRDDNMPRECAVVCVIDISPKGEVTYLIQEKLRSYNQWYCSEENLETEYHREDHIDYDLVLRTLESAVSHREVYDSATLYLEEPAQRHPQLFAQLAKDWLKTFSDICFAEGHPAPCYVSAETISQLTEELYSWYTTP